MKSIIFIILLSIMWTPNCWTKALFYTTTINIQEPEKQIRIALMHTYNPLIDHAEAQVLINNEWKCLDLKNGEVVVTNEQLKSEPYSILTLKQALKRHLQVIKEQKARKVFKKTKEIL